MKVGERQHGWQYAAPTSVEINNRKHLTKHISNPSLETQEQPSEDRLNLQNSRITSVTPNTSTARAERHFWEAPWVNFRSNLRAGRPTHEYTRGRPAIQGQAESL